MHRVAVLGAGITGITTAHSLLERGLDVTVFDRNRYAAMETSFANGGQLSASNAEVWNSVSTILKGLKWLGRSDAPLLVNPRPSVHKYGWFLEFLANIPHYRRNTIATARLAVEAREHLLRMAADAGVDFNAEHRGILHVYRNQAGFEHARKVTRLLGEAGVERRELTGEEVLAVDPALTGKFVGGFLTESDFTGDIHRFTRGLADACRARGASMRFETSIERVRWTRDGVVVSSSTGGEVVADRFDSVVVCAGVESRDIASMLGDRVNIYPVKGYSITVDLEDERSRAAAPWVSLLDDDAKIVTSRLGDDRLRVAGTAEFNGANRDIRADRIQPLVEWTRGMFPAMCTDKVLPWAGLRPMMPNMLPRVGPGRRPGVYYNTGHGHLGWTLAAATAEIVAAAVRGGTTVRPIAPAHPVADLGGAALAG